MRLVQPTSKHGSIATVLVGAAAFAPLPGCENLPGDEKGQGTVIGGAAGAAVGAAVAKDNRLLGALIGGVLGAGGGYLIGANWEKITGNDTEGAEEATRKAETDPATPDDARNAATADLNNDGFVTMDEVAAMEQAGLTDDEMVRRLEATGQIFELTPQQEEDLVGRGVSRYVVTQMRTINQAQRQQLLQQQQGVISRDRPAR